MPCSQEGIGGGQVHNGMRPNDLYKERSYHQPISGFRRRSSNTEQAITLKMQSIFLRRMQCYVSFTFPSVTYSLLIVPIGKIPCPLGMPTSIFVFSFPSLSVS